MLKMSSQRTHGSACDARNRLNEVTRRLMWKKEILIQGFFSTKSQPVGEKLFRNGSISSPHLKKKKKRFMLFQVNWFVYGECKHAYRTWQEITSTGQKSVYYDETRPCRIDQGRTRQDMK